jgi:hypothetical protein
MNISIMMLSITTISKMKLSIMTISTAAKM